MVTVLYGMYAMYLHVSIRWILLHRHAPLHLASERGGGLSYYGYYTSTASAIKKSRDTIAKETAPLNDEHFVQFVLSVSHLEFLVSLYFGMLRRRQPCVRLLSQLGMV